MRVARPANQPSPEKLPGDVRDIETIYRDITMLQRVSVVYRSIEMPRDFRWW